MTDLSAAPEPSCPGRCWNRTGKRRWRFGCAPMGVVCEQAQTAPSLRVGRAT
jgi:hypothetical protein